MRATLLCLLLPLLTVAIPVCAHAQCDSEVRDESYNDYQLNEIGKKARSAITLDSVFMPNTLGIDMHYVVSPDTLGIPIKYPFWVRGIGKANDSLLLWRDPWYEDAPVMFGNYKCKGIANYRYLKKNYRLMTLDEVREEYCAGLKGDVLYMINKFFIMTDEEYYKIDSDYILRVSVVSSKDIDALKDRKPFSIIRILTKTRHNCEVEGLNGYPMDDIRW